MTGFISYDSIITAMTAGKQRDALFSKTTPTMTANLFYSSWSLAGIPTAGLFQGVGLTSRSIDSSVQGAMGFGAAAVAHQRFLTGVGASISAATGPHVLQLIDRLGDLGSTTFAAASSGAYSALTLPRYASAATTITNSGRAANVATITTSAPHGYEVGFAVTPACVTNTGLNPATNTQVIITSVPTTSSFTYVSVGGDVTPSADTGSVVDCQGVQVFVEVSGTLGTVAGVTAVLTYTNQSGTGGRVTGSIAMGAVTQGCLQSGGFFVPLQAGDTGVRSVESIAITGTTTGTISVVFAKAITMLPTSAGAYVERDMVLQTPKMFQLRDSAALQWIYMSGLATAGNLAGIVSAVEP